MWWQCISFIWMCGSVCAKRFCACVVTFPLLQAHSTCKRGFEKAAAGSEPTLSKTWCSAIYHTWPTHLVEGTQTKTQTKHKPKTINTIFLKTIYDLLATPRNKKTPWKQTINPFALCFWDVRKIHLYKTKIRKSTHQRACVPKKIFSYLRTYPVVEN